MYAADNLSAYAVFGHRHTGELLEQLHLDDRSDSVHATSASDSTGNSVNDLRAAETRTQSQPKSMLSLRSSIETSPLVRLHPSPQLPQIQHVVRTNFCDLGFELGPDGKRLVMVSCLDNLLKGAAGQAVQNMNLMCGWDEQEGLL